MVGPLTALLSPRRAALAAALCALAGAPTQSAHADQLDTVNFTAGSLLRYDSNLFRSPDGATGPKDDTANISYVRVAIDKPYSLQRFQLSATDTVTRYNAFTFLDNNALDYRAAWLWSVTPHLTGVLSADRTQTQVPFTLTNAGQRNVRTTNSRDFSFDGWVSGAWHLLG
ncbi:MAG: hypothetical protein ABIS45_01295, partial [Burkholderiales bacterium]